MPGIIARIGGADGTDRERESVVSRLSHFPFYQATHAVSAHGWLGWVGIGRAAGHLAHEENGRYVTVFHGDRAGDGELEEKLKSGPLVADSIRRNPTELAERFGGSFTIATLDTQTGEFCCQGDLFGHFRTYYRQFEDTLYVCCELKGFLGWDELDIAPDTDALRDLINYAYPLGDKTSLRDVRLLRPASRMIFSNGELSVDRYWRPTYEPQEGDDESLRDEGYALFEESFASKIGAGRKLLVPVSGGIDSRLLLGEAAKLELPLFAYTYGHARSRESAIALDLIGAVGEEGTFFQLDDLPSPRESVLRTSWFAEGMVNLGPAHVVAVGLHMIGYERDCLMVNGVYGGPTNFSNAYHNPADLVVGMDQMQKVTRIGHALLSRDHRTQSNYEKLLPDFAEHCDASYDEVIAEELPQHEPASQYFGHQKDAFFIDNRMFRFINQVDFNRYFWNEAFPLTSTRLYQFYLRLPDRVKFDRLLHRMMIVHNFPAAAAIINFNTGKPVSLEEGSTVRVGHPQRWRMAKYVLTRLTRGAFNPPDPENYQHREYIYKRNLEMRKVYETVLGCEHPLSESIFDYGVVREYLRKALRGSALVSNLATVLAWELWLRQLKARTWDVGI